MRLICEAVGAYSTLYDLLGWNKLALTCVAMVVQLNDNDLKGTC